MKTKQPLGLLSVFLFFMVAVTGSSFAQNNVGIGTNTPAADALLELLSSNKGLLVPRMSAAQRIAIVTPSNSLLVYDTDTMCYFFYQTPTSKWINLCAGTSLSLVPGPTGPTGPASVVPGPAGATGPTGAASSVPGPTGPTGFGSGTPGATGPTGPTGAASTVAGPTGPTGAVGATGSFTNNAWLIVGNSGTVAGTNFIGTLDANDFVTKTNGAAAANERQRVTSGGQVVVNNTTPYVNDVFSVYASGSATPITGHAATNPIALTAISGYSTGSGNGLYAENTLTGNGVFGNNYSTGAGVLGQNISSGYGVFGYKTANGYAVAGLAAVGSVAIGVYGQSSSAAPAVQAYNNGTGSGVIAQSLGSTPTIEALNTGTGDGTYSQSAANTGVFGVTLAPAGASIVPGVAGISANSIGVIGVGQLNANGTGVGGLGNGRMRLLVMPQGSGVAGTGATIGVYGAADTANTIAGDSVSGIARAGGYFVSGSDGKGPLPSFSNWAYVGYIDASNIHYKIQGPGVVSTVVNNTKNQSVVMFAPEAPEVLFEDYGQGELVDGKAHIKLDADFAKNISVSEKHALRVFIQLEGDCKGVFVSNKTGSDFDVTELGGGNSNVKFTYHVIGNRANTTNFNGTVPFADARFSKAAPPSFGTYKSIAPQKAQLVPLKPVSVPKTLASTTR